MGAQSKVQDYPVGKMGPSCCPMLMSWRCGVHWQKTVFVESIREFSPAAILFHHWCANMCTTCITLFWKPGNSPWRRWVKCSLCCVSGSRTHALLMVADWHTAGLVRHWHCHGWRPQSLGCLSARPDPSHSVGSIGQRCHNAQLSNTRALAVGQAVLLLGSGGWRLAAPAPPRLWKRTRRCAELEVLATTRG